MAKSLRSKTKRSYRAAKRDKGIYAVTDAARLHRLNSKLQTLIKSDEKSNDIVEDDVQGTEQSIHSEPSTSNDQDCNSMDVDGQAAVKVSTHGPRISRRTEWRLSKGLTAQPKSKGMNRQGGLAARRKAGRSKRRR